MIPSPAGTRGVVRLRVCGPHRGALFWGSAHLSVATLTGLGTAQRRGAPLGRSAPHVLDVYSKRHLEKEPANGDLKGVMQPRQHWGGVSSRRSQQLHGRRWAHRGG